MALRESEDRFRTIVETAQEGVWVTDAEGYTTFVNRRMAEMLQVRVEDVKGLSFYEFIAADDRAMMTASIERARSGDVGQVDFRLILKDGTPLWAIIAASPLYDSAGTFVGMLRMITDINPRKQAEIELMEARDRLEMRVHARTAEMQALIASLEEASQTQRRFIADASHDIRTPLTVILAEVDLMLRALPANSSVSPPLRLVVKEARRMSHLVDDLLTQATIDAWLPSDPNRLSNMDEVLFNAVERVDTIARDKHIEWDIQIAERPIQMRCDRGLMLRALTNVLENAVKYSPDGGVVEVELTKSSDTVTITCRDQGPGIDPHDLPHVFERFYRADRARITPGTGLGLSIVRGVIEKHGGLVTIESPSCGGVIASIRLPC